MYLPQRRVILVDAPEPQSDTSKQVYIYQLPQLILLENRVGPQKRGPVALKTNCKL